MRVYAEQAIHFDDVTKTFGDRNAVDALSFRVPRGSIYGLLGPNGAGKTTSIRMLMAILRPDSGRIRLLGHEPTDALKDRVGYLPEERGLYQGMKVLDNLAFFGSIQGLGPQEARRRGADWLHRLAIADTASLKLQELSKGNQQKVQFITTVVHEPDLLVLDEPFSGLDPVNQDLMRNTIQDLARGGATIVLSTHLMDEVERLCSHLTLIDQGRALVDGELEEVKRRWGTDTISLDIRGEPPALDKHPWVAEATRSGKTWEIRLAEGRDPSRFLSAISDRAEITRFEIRAPSLHNIFVRLVSRKGMDETTMRIRRPREEEART